MRFTFTVPGPPRPKERPRVRRDGRTFTPERTRAYESHVKACCLSTPGWSNPWVHDGEYRLDVVVYVSGAARADLDNVLKAIADALQGVAYRNDRQVSHATILRLQGEPRAEVTVTLLGMPDRRKR